MKDTHLNPQEHLNQQVDNKFIAMMLEIEKRYQAPHCLFQKYEKIRIEQWCKKLCQVTQNLQWKKNRNLYCMLLLDQVLSKKLHKPFIKMPLDGPMPMLSPTDVKAQLSDRFKKISAKLDSKKVSETLLEDDQEQCHYKRNLSDEHLYKNQGTSTKPLDLKQIKTQRQSRCQNSNKFTKPPRQTNMKATQSAQSLTDALSSAEISQERYKKPISTIKSILKQQPSSTKHKFDPFQNYSAQKQPRVIRFDSEDNSYVGDLDRQIESDIQQFKIKYQPEDQQVRPTGLVSTGAESSAMEELSLQNQVIKLKTDNEIMNITLRHLQEELDGKTETIRKQQEDLCNLRSTVINLQAENQRHVNSNTWQKDWQNNKENNTGSAYQKPLCPKGTTGIQSCNITSPYHYGLRPWYAYTSSTAQVSNTCYGQEKPEMTQKEPLRTFKDYLDMKSKPQYGLDHTKPTTLKETASPIRPSDQRFERKKDSVSNREDMANGVTNEDMREVWHIPKGMKGESDRQLLNFDEEFNKIFNNQ